MLTVKKPNSPLEKPCTLEKIPKESLSLEGVPLCNNMAGYIPALYTIKMHVDTEKIVLFREYLQPKARTASQKSAENCLTRGNYNGYLSKKTATRIRKMLTTWVSSVEQYKYQKKRKFERNIAYITTPTLTLPAAQMHDDNEIKRKILTPFIQDLKRKHSVINYFWVAEPQKNGNIHFHMIIDQYIDKQQLQTLWNKHVNSLGYVDAFALKYNHFNPPTTKIMKFRGRTRPINYLVKYVTKSEGGRPITGRLWGANDELKNMPTYAEFYDDKATKEVRAVIDSGKAKVIQDDFFVTIFCDVENLFIKTDSIIGRRMKSFYLQQFNELYATKIGVYTDVINNDNADLYKPNQIMEKITTMKQDNLKRKERKFLISELDKLDQEREDVLARLRVSNQANLFDTTSDFKRKMEQAKIEAKEHLAVIKEIKRALLEQLLQ